MNIWMEESNLSEHNLKNDILTNTMVEDEALYKYIKHDIQKRSSMPGYSPHFLGYSKTTF